MDWNVMAQYLPQYEKAAWLTLRLGVALKISAVCPHQPAVGHLAGCADDF